MNDRFKFSDIVGIFTKMKNIYQNEELLKINL